MSGIQRLDRGPRMSQAVIHGDTIFTAGTVADDPQADVGAQTRNILEKLESLLERAGSDKHHLISATIWLSDMAGFDAMNAVWDVWVSREHPPVRATVEARLAFPDLKVEIAVVAAKS
ncbi:MAG: RidA family protein [Azospirillaceae bacterium]